MNIRVRLLITLFIGFEPIPTSLLFFKLVVRPKPIFMAIFYTKRYT